jgi:D-sedoheptulose 7-phosphate isomerase
MPDLRGKISAYFNLLMRTTEKLDREEINVFLNLLLKARNEERRIFIMGNGGSAATASHFACDFNTGCSCGSGKPFRFVCLNDNIPIVTAYANDVGYAHVFVEQLKRLFFPGDTVAAISGSGNSENVLRAVEYANDNGGITIGITGFDGGKLKKIARYSVNIPIDDMQITEDLHMVLNHLSMKIIASLVREEN